MRNKQTTIDLITIETTMDELNQVVESLRTTATAYCEISSVSQAEFFEAGRNGLKPSLKVAMYDFEYTDERICRVDGKLYSIYRTYFVPGADLVELYLEERGGTKDEPESSSNDQST